MVKVNVPVAVGVPERIPPKESVRPAGRRLPLETVKVYGLLLPLAVMVLLLARSPAAHDQRVIGEPLGPELVAEGLIY